MYIFLRRNSDECLDMFMKTYYIKNLKSKFY